MKVENQVSGISFFGSNGPAQDKLTIASHLAVRLSAAVWGSFECSLKGIL